MNDWNTFNINRIRSVIHHVTCNIYSDELNLNHTFKCRRSNSYNIMFLDLNTDGRYQTKMSVKRTEICFQLPTSHFPVIKHFSVVWQYDLFDDTTYYHLINFFHRDVLLTPKKMIKVSFSNWLTDMMCWCRFLMGIAGFGSWDTSKSSDL